MFNIDSKFQCVFSSVCLGLTSGSHLCRAAHSPKHPQAWLLSSIMALTVEGDCLKKVLLISEVKYHRLTLMVISHNKSIPMALRDKLNKNEVWPCEYTCKEDYNEPPFCTSNTKPHLCVNAFLGLPGGLRFPGCMQRQEKSVVKGQLAFFPLNNFHGSWKSI